MQKNAYLIGHISVKDEEKWAEYRQAVPATLEPFSGELLFRGIADNVLSGQHSHKFTVVIRFPDLASLNAWHESAAYQALIPLRLSAADIDLISFEDQ